MGVLSSLLVAVGVDPAGVGKGLGAAETRVGKFAHGMSKTGAVLTTGITAPVIALGGFALKAALDVDDAYDTIRAGTGATGKALAGLEHSFDRVAKKTPADMGDVASTVADLNTRLGLTGPTLEKLSRQVLEAGRMGGVPVDIKNATGAFSIFNVKGKATTVAMDDLFRVSQATGVGVNDLTSIMAKSGGVLTQLGFNFSESASLIGVLDKAGINSRAVMSSMSAGLVKLAKDGEAPQDAFHRVTGKLQDFIDGGKDAKALKLAGEIFGTRGAGQFVAALKSGKVNLDDLTKSAGTSKDSILGVAKETEDFPELWQKFKNQATLALAPIGAQLMPKIGDALLKLTDLLQDAIDWWNGLSTGTQHFIEKAVLVAAAVGPILMIVAKLITVVQALAPLLKIITAAQWLWNTAMAANPIGVVVLAIAALVAGLVLAYKHSETFRNIVNGAFGAVRDFVGAALDWIVEKAKAWGPYMLGALAGPLGLIVVAVVKHWDQVKQFTSDALDWVVAKIKAWGPYMLGALGGPFGLAVVAVIKHWDQVRAKTSEIWGAVLDYVKAIPGKLLGFFLKWTLAGVIVDHWDDAKAGTIRVATSIVSWVADLPGRILGKLSDLDGRLREVFASAFQAARDAAQSRAAALLELVQSIPGKIKDKFSGAKTLLKQIGVNIVSGLVAGIDSVIHWVSEKIQKLADMIPGWVKKKLGIASPSRVMAEIGRHIVAGLVKGLRDTGDLRDALDSINDLIAKAADARFEKDKIAEAATRRVIVAIRDERAELLQNAHEYDRMVERLQKAKDKLHDLVKQARDYAHSIRDAIVETGNVTQFVDTETGTVTADQILQGMREKVLHAMEYAATLQQLVALGLNRTTIDQLTQAGVEGGLATAEALMQGGQDAIDQMNALQGQLQTVGGNLGNGLADTMYGAGIDSAQALVDGLEKKRKALEKTGRKLAKSFLAALQAELDSGKLTVTLPKISIDDVYSSAAQSSSPTTPKKLTGAATSTASAARTPSDLLDAIEDLRSEVANVATKVETQPRTTQTLARKGG